MTVAHAQKQRCYPQSICSGWLDPSLLSAENAQARRTKDRKVLTTMKTHFYFQQSSTSPVSTFGVVVVVVEAVVGVVEVELLVVVLMIVVIVMVVVVVTFVVAASLLVVALVVVAVVVAVVAVVLEVVAVLYFKGMVW